MKPLAIATLAAALFSGTAAAEAPDWEALGEVAVIEVITHDEDGDARETKVWFVRIEGEIYLRTSRSVWLENLRRDPNLVVRIEGREYPARAEEVTTPELIEAVDAASLEKYGWQERFIHVFRMRVPDILRLSP